MLTDIGTEEMDHMEMIATMVYQLTKNATLRTDGRGRACFHFADHGKALFYVDAGGNPFTVTYIQAKDDPITDLTEDMAAEQKARATYNHLLDMSQQLQYDDVSEVLAFLREREVVHFQRFGEL